MEVDGDGNMHVDGESSDDDEGGLGRDPERQGECPISALDLRRGVVPTCSLIVCFRPAGDTFKLSSSLASTSLEDGLAARLQEPIARRRAWFPDIRCSSLIRIFFRRPWPGSLRSSIQAAGPWWCRCQSLWSLTVRPTETQHHLVKTPRLRSPISPHISPHTPHPSKSRRLVETTRQTSTSDRRRSIPLVGPGSAVWMT